ncbi:hypothetical protein M3Y98_01064800 [Aphelenchoides besseyi]|nr:hypothetical protein M3Y98_01064800 [Aphelenchoides besseyi]KAI6209667.1 hypothetical protein M3Y96_00245000 [Aphelenchoides besseyi]
MGCHLSRRRDCDSKHDVYQSSLGRISTERRNTNGGAETPINNRNGHLALNRRDTPTKVLIENGLSSAPVASKPLSQIGSNSQTEFFRMLDEKIAQGHCDLSDSESER